MGPCGRPCNVWPNFFGSPNGALGVRAGMAERREGLGVALAGSSPGCKSEWGEKNGEKLALGDIRESFG